MISPYLIDMMLIFNAVLTRVLLRCILNIYVTFDCVLKVCPYLRGEILNYYATMALASKKTLLSYLNRRKKAKIFKCDLNYKL